MTKSTEMSKHFYMRLKTEGLSSKTTKKWDSLIIKNLIGRLKKGDTILDLGCGYGRIAVPLSKKGYSVYGIDLSTTLLRDAKKYAKQEGSSAKFKIGNMCELDYQSETFDAVICLWSSFHELLTVKEQLKTIRGIKRVLKKGGWALIEGPAHKRADKRVSNDLIDGIPNYHYRHDRKTYSKLMKSANIKDFRISDEEFGNRTRRILTFKKR